MTLLSGDVEFIGPRREERWSRQNSLNLKNLVFVGFVFLTSFILFISMKTLNHLPPFKSRGQLSQAISQIVNLKKIVFGFFLNFLHSFYQYENTESFPTL